MKEADKFDLLETSSDPFQYFIDVYVDDFISLMVPMSREQLHHVANAVIPGLHDVFLADEVDEEDPMSLKKLLKL